MNEATILLSAVERGDPKAADQLLELVYQDLRHLANHKMPRNRLARRSNRLPWCMRHGCVSSARSIRILRTALISFLPQLKQCVES